MFPEAKGPRPGTLTQEGRGAVPGCGWYLQFICSSPYGIRSWKCRIAAASLRGIEIASASLSGQPLLPADLILLLKPTQRQ